MRARRRWMLALLTSLGSCFLLGASCKDTVRQAVFTGALQFVQGRVQTGFLNNLPVDDIISTVLNPFTVST